MIVYLTRNAGCMWFFRLPHIHWNGGLPFRDAVTDIGFDWRSTAWHLTFWWKANNGSESWFQTMGFAASRPSATTGTQENNG